MMRMIKCKIFSGKNKDVEPELSKFFGTFPDDYDMKNIKMRSSGGGAVWTHLVVIYKAF